MGNNSQSRKWALVINNPSEAGLDHAAIAKLLSLFSPAYYCMADEIATTGTYHTHVFFYTPSPARFPTVKHRFPTAHIEKAYGSVRDNRAYIRKEGRWADTDKAETSVPGTFEEWGEIPPESSEKHPEMFRLVQNIREGLTTTEIIDDNPALAFRVRDIDLLRQTLTAEKYAVENRPLEVTYLYGASGTGKTRSIYQNHDPRSIYRVTNYRVSKGISFDGYHGQDVLVFEEFNSQIPIEDMLNYLDIYPWRSRPGTTTKRPVTRKSISPPTSRWKSSTGANSGTGRRPGGLFSAVSIPSSNICRTAPPSSGRKGISL